MLNNLHSTINLPEYQHPGYYNMPDMLSVGQGRQTQAQYRAQMLLWSVLGAPLILGADIRKMDAFTTAVRALSVPHSKSVLCGAFVWAHSRALNDPKRRFPARAVGDGHRSPRRQRRPRRRAGLVAAEPRRLRGPALRYKSL
jgi:hypothetical protein